MTPLRVLHVIPSLGMEDGGPTRAMLEIERGLAAEGVEITTVTTVSGRDQRLPPPPDHVRRVCVRRVGTAYKFAPGLAAVLPRLLRQTDIVHVHALFSFAPNLAAFGARVIGVPYIVRPLGTLGDYGLTTRRPRLKRLSLACVEGRLLRGAAAVHFTSFAELEEAKRLEVPMRGVVIPLGLAKPPEARPEAFDHPELAGRTVLLFLSRLDPKKNLESLIDAVAGSDVFKASGMLLVAGDGGKTYVASLKARAAQAGLGGRIIWLGHVDGAEKAAVLAAAHAFVLPSFSENFGIAAVEAMAAGLPCVLGRGVALAEDVAQGGAGLVVGPDAASIRDAIEQLLTAPRRRVAMAEAARALAADRYSSAAMARRLVQLYEDVGAGRQGRTG